MKFLYQYDGKTFEVTITEVDSDKVQTMTTEDDGGVDDNEAKPKKPRIPLIVVFPY
jgi:hypothetical protein